MQRRTFAPLLAIIFLLLIAPAAMADVIYDEALDGELSDDALAPTSIAAFSIGSNRMIGQLNESGFDPDFWTVVVAPGQRLQQIILVDYLEDQFSFLGIEAGNQITDTSGGANLMGGVLFGSLDGTTVGDDLLDDLAAGSVAGSGFSTPLGPGTYTFWMQEGTSSGMTIDYELDFVIGVPEPGSLAFGFGVCCFGLLRRRR